MNAHSRKEDWARSPDRAQQAAVWADRLTQATTALAVIAVASVAAVISYQHILELTRSHGEDGLTARLVPVTVDGLIWAASMVVLDAGRRSCPAPRAGAVEPGSGHRGDRRCQRGARRRARRHRGPDQRMARARPHRLLRTADDPYPQRDTALHRRRTPAMHHAGATGSRARRSGADRGASGAGRIPGKPQRPRPPLVTAASG
ncbi:DUF2637 domain-containing protein [Actinomadura sp. LD22]|uniref:DUF2637 domain-containing protein n=1 Tax=Actinomadura physcomitrii TaxID=2650748 RepID=A0A6I4MEE4_9ACTN|nr:DUF2637 domain-containing protein [Actinomadura physcomitrii]